VKLGASSLILSITVISWSPEFYGRSAASRIFGQCLVPRGDSSMLCHMHRNCPAGHTAGGVAVCQTVTLPCCEKELCAVGTQLHLNWRAVEAVLAPKLIDKIALERKVQASRLVCE